GADVTVIARSPARLAVARVCGTAHVYELEDARKSLVATADVVVDASGSPDAIHEAAALATNGARIVLLGSPRGMSRDVDLSAWQDRRLHLLGVHATTMFASAEAPGRLSWRRECEIFLRFAAQRRLVLEPLTSERIPPDRLSEAYERLS